MSHCRLTLPLGWCSTVVCGAGVNSFSVCSLLCFRRLHSVGVTCTRHALKKDADVLVGSDLRDARRFLHLPDYGALSLHDGPLVACVVRGVAVSVW